MGSESLSSLLSGGLSFSKNARVMIPFEFNRWGGLVIDHLIWHRRKLRRASERSKAIARLKGPGLENMLIKMAVIDATNEITNRD